MHFILFSLLSNTLLCLWCHFFPLDDLNSVWEKRLSEERTSLEQRQSGKIEVKSCGVFFLSVNLLCIDINVIY